MKKIFLKQLKSWEGPSFLSKILYYHTPVLTHEIADELKDFTHRFLLVDATVGEGGHSAMLLEKFPNMDLVGVDADAEILRRAKERLRKYSSRVRLYHMWNDDFFLSSPFSRCDSFGFRSFSVPL